MQEERPRSSRHDRLLPSWIGSMSHAEENARSALWYGRLLADPDAGDLMNTLYVYADECGGIPLDDADEPFVGAAVSATQPVTGTTSLRFDVGLLLRHMARSGASPFLAHVKPFPGYGQQVTSKLSKMDTMARARRLTTGVHAYSPPGGIALRHVLWIHCVSQAVGMAFTRRAFQVPISRLVVTFDRLTLVPESRCLVIDECRKIPERLLAIANENHSSAPRQLDGLIGNLQVGPADVVIQWSDDPSASGTEDGLHLADRLAWHYQKHLQKPTTPSFLDLLAQAGHTGITHDVTPLVIAPLERGSIETWKRDTGLPEPDL